MASRKRTALIVYSAVVLVIAAIASVVVRALWNSASTSVSYPHCTVGSYDIDTSQASVAASMVGAVTSYSPRLPDRAAVLAIAAGLQESKLRNLLPGEGDRDSVGVLQQRPSQGWGHGHASELQDVFDATTEFLDHLVQIDNWQRLPLAEAVQRVQISADGSAYAQHEPEATALAHALLGRTPAQVNCTFDKPTKVATASAVVARLRHELPVNTPTVAGTTITVPGAGWQTSAWFVSNADLLGVDAVGYDGKQWTRANGWRAASTATNSAVVATMAVVNTK